MLRISAGRFKGLGLKTPPGIRATESRVRQALFNILGPFIEGARMVDGFAGSGAVGLEALSRGAAFVAFVEADTDSILCLRDNLARVEHELPREAWRVLHMDLQRGLQDVARSATPFDLVFLDPPYDSEEGKNALNPVGGCAMLAANGVVAIEHHRRTVMPLSAGSLRQWKQHRYGTTVLSFYRTAP